MLIPSDFTIAIRPSNDFLKLGILLHGLACFLLWTSSLPLLWRMVLCLGMMVSCLWFAHKTRFFTSTLLLRAGSWILQTSPESNETYERLSIDFDGGFYVYLKLSNSSDIHKKLLVFKDQWTPEEERLLRMVSTMTHNKV